MAGLFDDPDHREPHGEEGPGDGLPACPPRANPTLIGHEKAEKLLLSAFLSGRFPHAVIIGGPRGIGKATLAFRLARFLLAQGGAEGGGGLFESASPDSLALSPDHPVFKRVASAGHADLLTIERETDPKTKRLRGEIVVQDTRAIASFLRLTSAEGGSRIVIVDGADEMNRNAANALLKILEEPPANAFLLLVSHHPGRLLPTIRSRCRFLGLQPLPEEEVSLMLARRHPELAAEDRALLARLSEGSIGRALELAGTGGLDLYRQLIGLLTQLPELDAVALHAFADRMARPDAADACRTMSELMTGWLARMVRQAATGEGEETADAREAAAFRRLAARRGLDQWVEVWEKIARLFLQADGLNLDRKQVVLNAFFALEAASR